jgi:hypothetical protein
MHWHDEVSCSTQTILRFNSFLNSTGYSQVNITLLFVIISMSYMKHMISIFSFLNSTRNSPRKVNTTLLSYRCHTWSTWFQCFSFLNSTRNSPRKVNTTLLSYRCHTRSAWFQCSEWNCSVKWLSYMFIRSSWTECSVISEERVCFFFV